MASGGGARASPAIVAQFRDSIARIRRSSSAVIGLPETTLRPLPRAIKVVCNVVQVETQPTTYCVRTGPPTVTRMSVRAAGDRRFDNATSSDFRRYTHSVTARNKRPREMHG